MKNSLLVLTHTFLRLEIRNKQALIMGVLFPVIMLIMMGIAGQSESRGSMSYMAYILPGILGMAYASIGLIAMPIMLSHYRENNFLIYLKVTPVNIAKFLTSLFMTQIIIMALQTLLLLGLCNLALKLNLSFRVPDLFYLLFVLLLSSITLMSIGLLISIIAGNVKNTTTLGNIMNLILTFLGGAFFPTDVWPKFLAPIIALNPLTHMITITRKALLFNTLTAGDLYYALSFLLLTGLICFLLATKFFTYKCKNR